MNVATRINNDHPSAIASREFRETFDRDQCEITGMPAVLSSVADWLDTMFCYRHIDIATMFPRTDATLPHVDWPLENANKLSRYPDL